MCLYFLNISSTFEQYRDNTDNRDHFGHYDRDKKCSYRNVHKLDQEKLRVKKKKNTVPNNIGPYLFIRVYWKKKKNEHIKHNYFEH